MEYDVKSEYANLDLLLTKCGILREPTNLLE